MRYAPCTHCGSVIVFDANQPLCGSCALFMEEEQTEQLEYLQSVREENEDWGSEADLAEADLFEEEMRQQMEEDDQMLYADRLRGNTTSDGLFRRIYTAESLQQEEEEELYENDQDDFDFDMSYDDNIQAIRDGLSTRRFELALDRSALAQRLLRIFVNEDGLDTESQAKGATESDIATLKTRTSSMNEQECAICTEHFNNLELTQLPCKHEYHSECIHHWLKLNASCPMCRQSISTSSQQVQEEPDLIILSRETATYMQQTNSPSSFMDDVD
ncbi:uncharacterized protein EV154DRAFT_519879 [Mucor mucedo]|uniref:uncharacterized protein n=1 Tax=Mucor mucedo TaxID=29922 RepID=UPI00221F15F8|nr:uncharacterized protein EV154DRAFT_519879 [Mucor mucedo]KAI7887747.1 hypothetical protein EV154DRAFT_519879 [Mucor mucedo]